MRRSTLSCVALLLLSCTGQGARRTAEEGGLRAGATDGVGRGAGQEAPLGGVEPDMGTPGPYERRDGHLTAPVGYPQLRFPVSDEDLSLISTRFVIGVDHDPGAGAALTDCKSRDGRAFPFCYDEHRGSDFLLEGGFATMDAGSAQVVAAASGVVIERHDGEYDRCHADITTADVSCDGYEMRPNYITLRHEGGWESSYLHLKTDSLLVELGDEVTCGQALALIGSSGYSSAPHLHFELVGPLGQTWDPFAGEVSQPYSLWTDEGEGTLPLTLCLP